MTGVNSAAIPAPSPESLSDLNRRKERITASRDGLKKELETVESWENSNARDLLQAEHLSSIRQKDYRKACVLTGGIAAASTVGTLAGLALLPPVGIMLGVGTCISVLLAMHRQKVAKYDRDSAVFKLREAQGNVAFLEKKKRALEEQISREESLLAQIDDIKEGRARKELEEEARAVDPSGHKEDPGISDSDDFIIVDTVKLDKKKHHFGPSS